MTEHLTELSFHIISLPRHETQRDRLRELRREGSLVDIHPDTDDRLCDRALGQSVVDQYAGYLVAIDEDIVWPFDLNSILTRELLLVAFINRYGGRLTDRPDLLQRSMQTKVNRRQRIEPRTTKPAIV